MMNKNAQGTLLSERCGQTSDETIVDEALAAYVALLSGEALSGSTAHAERSAAVPQIAMFDARHVRSMAARAGMSHATAARVTAPASLVGQSGLPDLSLDFEEGACPKVTRKMDPNEWIALRTEMPPRAPSEAPASRVAGASRPSTSPRTPAPRRDVVQSALPPGGSLSLGHFWAHSGTNATASLPLQGGTRSKADSLAAVCGEVPSVDATRLVEEASLVGSLKQSRFHVAVGVGALLGLSVAVFIRANAPSIHSSFIAESPPVAALAEPYTLATASLAAAPVVTGSKKLAAIASSDAPESKSTPERR